ncbi:MAG: hypothetical protein ACODAB_09780 [Gemmatimonadota bacterium]
MNDRASEWLDLIARAYLMAPEGSAEEDHLEKALDHACFAAGAEPHEVINRHPDVGVLDEDELLPEPTDQSVLDAADDLGMDARTPGNTGGETGTLG